MPNNPTPSTYEALVRALHKILKTTEKSYQHQLQEAKETLQELEHHTEEEIDTAAQSLTEDLHHLKTVVVDSEQAFEDLWILNQYKVSSEVATLLQEVADQTQLAHLKLALKAKGGSCNPP